MFNITQIIKQLDRIIGPILLKIMPQKKRQVLKHSGTQKILVVRPGGLGDAALLLPALKALNKKYPFTSIDVLCEPRNMSVFNAVSFIDQILSYQNPVSYLILLKKTYTVIIDTEQSHFLSAVIAGLLKANIKIGFKVNGREKIYDLSFPYDQKRYEAKMFWDLFNTYFNLPTCFSLDFPYFKSYKGTKFFQDLTEGFICIFPGATINERLWPEKRWADVIDGLAQTGISSVLLGGRNETTQCRRIKSLTQTGKITDLCGRLSILETVWLFKRSILLISTDSGILHIGVMSNLPTVSLFGSGIADKWAPIGKKHIVLNKKLDCSPCTLFGHTPACSNEKACLMQISVKDVIVAARKCLNKTQKA